METSIPQSIAFCCTTINPRSRQLAKNLKLWQSSQHRGKTYIALDRRNGQSERFISYFRNPQSVLERMIGFDTYSRKNIAFLDAAIAGNDFIFETDDDNEVLEMPSESVFSRRSTTEETFLTGNLFERLYNTNDQIWARGFPLSWLDEPEEIGFDISLIEGRVGVVQYLVKGNPDVDAIFRLVKGSELNVDVNASILPFGVKSFHPFNSQGTLWPRRNYPLMYLPQSCEFRMTDIFRGYIAQRILSEFDEYVLFEKPILRQVRNEHRITDDFFGELDGYKQTIMVIKTLKDLSLSGSKCEMLKSCYEALIKVNIFRKEERRLVEEWATFFAEREKS